MKRRFVDAPQFCRCSATITLRDKSKAQCGRYRLESLVLGGGPSLCAQHRKMALARGEAMFHGVEYMPARG